MSGKKKKPKKGNKAHPDADSGRRGRRKGLDHPQPDSSVSQRSRGEGILTCARHRSICLAACEAGIRQQVAVFTTTSKDPTS